MERQPYDEPISASINLLRISIAGFILVQGDPTYQDGAAWQKAGLRVLASHAREADGMLWLHVSVSRSDRIPSWDDLKVIRTVFIGDDRLALQVFPPKEEWINLHPYCLHLWAPLGHNPIPDFRHEAQTPDGVTLGFVGI